MIEEPVRPLCDELKKRVEHFRSDYAKRQGTPFEHFFCPILHVDEHVNLIKGHVTPQSLDKTGPWVPQREDIDNFYGWAIEPEFSAIVEDRTKDIGDIWLDPKHRNIHKPRVELGGQPVEHYFTNKPDKVPPAHTIGMIYRGQDELCNFAVKKTLDELAALETKLELVIERDYRPFVVAAALKSAHLTMFHMLGYEYVFSTAGRFTADALASFFRNHRNTPRRELEPHVEKQFRPFFNTVVPIVKSDDLQGTVKDKRIMTCFDGDGRTFAIGVVVVSGGDKFCAFLPGNDFTIDTYFSFAKEPAQSIAVRVAQFVESDAEKGSHWAIGPGDPVRVNMPLSMPITNGSEATSSA